MTNCCVGLTWVDHPVSRPQPHCFHRLTGLIRSPVFQLRLVITRKFESQISYCQDSLHLGLLVVENRQQHAWVEEHYVTSSRLREGIESNTQHLVVEVIHHQMKAILLISPLLNGAVFGFLPFEVISWDAQRKAPTDQLEDELHEPVLMGPPSRLLRVLTFLLEVVIG